MYESLLLRNGYQVLVTYKKRLLCTKEVLMEQFIKVLTKEMGAMSRQRREAKEHGSSVSQVRCFIKLKLTSILRIQTVV